MVIKLQGKWEAERIARILECYTFANSEELGPWRDDCVKRIRNQVYEKMCRDREIKWKV